MQWRSILAITLSMAGCGWANAAAVTEVLVEEAYVIPDAGDPESASVYVVINNRTTGEVALTEVRSPLADRSILRNGKGQPVPNGQIAIPIHSELYMIPGGIHVAMTGVTMPQGDQFPIILKLSGSMRANFIARVLPPGAPIPDHHDYRHEGS